MKRLILFIAFIAAMAMANAQAPAAFKYQAVVRNSAGTVIANQNVSFRIGILQGSVSGAVAYSESHVATTNNFGLVSLEIGQGAAPMGNLAELDWSAGPYFVKIEVDPAGGTDYIEMSTTQLLSVPYALYANKANESDPIFSASVAKGIGEADTAKWNKAAKNPTGFTHWVGELWGGGIVFHVYKDQNGEEHGLIASLIDLSTSQLWINPIQDIGVAAQSDWNGQANTLAIINQVGNTSTAALLCGNYINEDYGTGVFSDWYLPAIDELVKLYDQRLVVNKVLDSDGNSSTIPLSKTHYWSSTEVSSVSARYVYFVDGYSYASNVKNTTAYVRSIRAF